MSHCAACDVNLSDFESTRKIVQSDGMIYYPDLCNTCFKSSGIASLSSVVERHDLSHHLDYMEEFEYDEEGFSTILGIDIREE